MPDWARAVNSVLNLPRMQPPDIAGDDGDAPARSNAMDVVRTVLDFEDDDA